jgi:hypothetical protein
LVENCRFRVKGLMIEEGELKDGVMVENLMLSVQWWALSS